MLNPSIALSIMLAAHHKIMQLASHRMTRRRSPWHSLAPARRTCAAMWSRASDAVGTRGAAAVDRPLQACIERGLYWAWLSGRVLSSWQVLE
jgi:hypothetical protein